MKSFNRKVHKGSKQEPQILKKVAEEKSSVLSSIETMMRDLEEAGVIAPGLVSPTVNLAPEKK